MRWCCVGFEDCHANAGRRGISIIVGRNMSGQHSFILQSRAVDLTNQVRANFEAVGVAVSIVSEVLIVNCPWCGRRLHNWYFPDFDELSRPEFQIPLP